VNIGPSTRRIGFDNTYVKPDAFQVTCGFKKAELRAIPFCIYN